MNKKIDKLNKIIDAKGSCKWDCSEECPIYYNAEGKFGCFNSKVMESYIKDNKVDWKTWFTTGKKQVTINQAKAYLTYINKQD